ncbi:MAG: right-handed parallel beta-helix repeat-containing protein [Flavobacteriales bacterium]|nr:right-handed parallel beta-helix repeat-containing protein [Flavobacteriales bacterium]
MKNFKIILMSVAMLAASTLTATIHNVNNLSPNPGQYSTPSAAVAAAMSGDTLLLAGTGMSYGSFNVDKQLTILGPGWIVNGGGYSGNAQVGTIALTTLSAAGTKVMGLRLFQINTNDGLINIYTGITVQRCVIDDCIFTGNDDWSGCLIEGNLFTSPGANTFSTAATSNIIASTIRNNIFNGIMYYVNSNLITQNIHLGNSNGNTAIVSTGTGNTFTNNVVIGRNCNTIDVTSTVNANITYLCMNPNLPGAGNFPNTNPMFVNYVNGLYSWLHDFHLQAGSPALGMGVSGYDIGVYSGGGIYRKDGEPDIPVMRAATVTGGVIHPANSIIQVSVIGVTHE